MVSVRVDIRLEMLHAWGHGQFYQPFENLPMREPARPNRDHARADIPAASPVHRRMGYQVLNLDMTLQQTENDRVCPGGGVMLRRVPALSIVAVVCLATSLLAQKSLTATESKAHIGGRERSAVRW